MAATSFEWDSSKNAFQEVSDPIDFENGNDVAEAISNTGYYPEISSNLEGDSIGATVTIYGTSKSNLPAYYIDIMGQNTGIATFVARDFLSLLETLKQLQPILSMIGLDQFASKHNL